MDAFRNWWMQFVRGFIARVGEAWDRLAYAVMYQWDVPMLLLVFGIVVVASALLTWRRRA